MAVALPRQNATAFYVKRPAASGDAEKRWVQTGENFGPEANHALGILSSATSSARIAATVPRRAWQPK